MHKRGDLGGRKLEAEASSMTPRRQDSWGLKSYFILFLWLVYVYRHSHNRQCSPNKYFSSDLL